jgi:preprotein translocase subunit SecA
MLRAVYDELAGGIVEYLVSRTAGSAKHPGEWDWDWLRGELQMMFLADFTPDEVQRRDVTQEALRKNLTDISSRRYDERRKELGDRQFGDLCRSVFLYTIDSKWREHLYALDTLREGISLSAYGQKDPLVEYKRESFDLFQEMMRDLYRDALMVLFRAQVRSVDERQRQPSRRSVRAYKPDASSSEPGQAEPVRTTQSRRPADKVGRNEPCPCGSGKKYKRCCGSNRPE